MFTDTAVYVDGESYTLDDLEYGEQRAMRELVREIAPNHDLEEAAEIDYIPAMVCVIKRRTEPGYTIEQAYKLKQADITPPEDDGPPPSGAETPVESGSPTT